MYCKNCNAEITSSCITVTLGDTDLDLIIHCYDCDSDYGVNLTNADLEDI